MSESFSQAPYSGILPAYAYAQYAGDENIQAFFSALNSIQQGYLNWFYQNPLALYTNSGITGLLLDWIAQGIYGIVRPILVTPSATRAGSLGTNILGTHPLATLDIIAASTAVPVSDDIYKRFMTWILYRGDGLHFSLPWLLRRVERFLGGPNGVDAPLDLSTRPTIDVSGFDFTIKIPTANPSSAVLQSLMSEGYFPVPVPYSFTVDLV